MLKKEEERSLFGHPKSLLRGKKKSDFQQTLTAVLWCNVLKIFGGENVNLGLFIAKMTFKYKGHRKKYCKHARAQEIRFP